MTENSDIRVLIVIVQALLATMVLSSLLSIMHAFTGGSRAELLQLESYQVFGIGLSFGTLLYSLVFFSKDGAPLAGAKTAWQYMPGWLIFSAIVLNLLAFVGELSYLLLQDATEILWEWINHVALLCLAASSIGFAFLFAVGHAQAGGKPFAKNRW